MKGGSLWRALALVVLVFGAAWIAVILGWRASHRAPNDVDVGLYLLVLPVVVLLGVTLAWWGAGKVRQRKRRAAPPAASTDDAASPEPDDPALGWRVPILAVDALFAGGDSLAALAEAARTGRRAALHATLKNARGLPVFAAEAQGIDVAAVEDTLPDSARHWSDARKRTLTLAQTLAGRVLEEHFDALAATPGPADPADERPASPVLQLEWLLPGWGDADGDVARDWLGEQLAPQGWGAPRIAIATRATVDGTAALMRLDELNRAFHGDTPPLPHLLLASDSHIDEATIVDWEAARDLHGAAQPDGRVPGEGASMVLLAAPNRRATAGSNSAAAPRDPATHRAIAYLHRLLAAPRARPVDRPGRLESDTLQELAREALTQARVSTEALGQMVSDTDVRASRSAEAAHFLEQLLPDCDPPGTLLPLGMASGDCGPALALALAAVAVAARWTADTQRPSLVFTHHDASTRVVGLITATPADPSDRSTPTLT